MLQHGDGRQVAPWRICQLSTACFKQRPRIATELKVDRTREEWRSSLVHCSEAIWQNASAQTAKFASRHCQAKRTQSELATFELARPCTDVLLFCVTACVVVRACIAKSTCSLSSTLALTNLKEVDIIIRDQNATSGKRRKFYDLLELIQMIVHIWRRIILDNFWLLTLLPSCL